MNKGTFSFPERFRGESFHGFPSKNKSPLFFGFPSGSEVYDFKCDANTANFAFRITLAAESGSRIVIDKGNGESITAIGTGGNVNIDWTYPQAGQYNINLSGETSRITGIAINNRRLIGNLSQSFVDKIQNIQVFNVAGNLISGTLPSFASCTALTIFYCHANQFSGELPSFASCTALTQFQCNNNQFSGELPSFANNNKLRSLWASSNFFSGTVYLPSSQANFNDVFRIDSLKDEFSFNSIIYNNTIINGQGIINHFDISNADIDEAIPFGSNVVCRNSLAINCGISDANINLSIRNLYYGRNNFNLTVQKTLNISGQTNGVPNGVFQQPSGFNHDLTEAQLDALNLTEKEMIWILINCQVSSSSLVKRFNWSTITTN